MWQKNLKKTIFTVNVDNYAPEVTALTYPLIRRYADKIGANFHIINDRKFPEYPPVYEKMQIYQLAQEMENDWNIYIDSDTLIHPEFIDMTLFINKDTVAHHGADMANVRWKYDRYFMRDGRNIGSCNWFTMASDWCIELWKPLDDITFEEAVANISPTVGEINTIITAEHLIDDYLLSRNIAKYGLKFITFLELFQKLNLGTSYFLWHEYTIDIKEKVIRMEQVLKDWSLK